jgi:hypothetical protein
METLRPLVHPYRAERFEQRFEDYSPVNACAVKAGAFQWEVAPPGNWFVPPGNNRSGGGGNKAVGAFDVKGRLSGSVSM